MLDLALSQIYTRAIHLWESVALDNAFFARVFSRITLESLGVGNAAQVPGYRPKVGENHASRSPVSATF